MAFRSSCLRYQTLTHWTIVPALSMDDFWGRFNTIFGRIWLSENGRCNCHNYTLKRKGSDQQRGHLISEVWETMCDYTDRVLCSCEKVLALSRWTHNAAPGSYGKIKPQYKEKQAERWVTQTQTVSLELKIQAGSWRPGLRSIQPPATLSLHSQKYNEKQRTCEAHQTWSRGAILSLSLPPRAEKPLQPQFPQLWSAANSGSHLQAGLRNAWIITQKAREQRRVQGPQCSIYKGGFDQPSWVVL